MQAWQGLVKGVGGSRRHLFGAAIFIRGYASLPAGEGVG